MLKPECFQDRRFRAKSSPEELRHRLKPGERDIEEDTLLIKATPQNDGMEVGFHRSMSPKVWDNLVTKILRPLLILPLLIAPVIAVLM